MVLKATSVNSPILTFGATTEDLSIDAVKFSQPKPFEMSFKCEHTGRVSMNQQLIMKEVRIATELAHISPCSLSCSNCVLHIIGEMGHVDYPN